jgi:DNA-directed RNA polymerase specialized sigma subunit
MSLLATADPAVRSLVHGVVKQYWRPGINRDDLIEAGMSAAALAAERFNPQRGSKLTTFLRPAVRGAVVDAVNQSRMIHVPERFQGNLDPDQTGECIEAARRVRGARFVTNSTDEEGSILDLLTDDHTGPDKWIVAALVDELTDIEARVIRCLWGLDDTAPVELHELADVLALTTDEVTEIHDHAFETLRRRFDDHDYDVLITEEPTMSRLNGFHAAEPTGTATEPSNGHCCPSCGGAYKTKSQRCYDRSCPRSGYAAKSAKASKRQPARVDRPSATVDATVPSAGPSGSLADEIQAMTLLTTLMPAARLRVLAWAQSAFVQ